MNKIAVDLGTTRIKVSVFDHCGKEAASCGTEYKLEFPQDNYIEQDADLWWNLTCALVRKAVAESGLKPDFCIGISSQGISVVPVDAELKPLRKAISWLDHRAEKELEWLSEVLSQEEFFHITGKRLLGLYTLPKILWIKNHQPDIFSRTYKMLLPCDFLVAKMTGNTVIDRTMAGGMLVYDINKDCYSSEILSAAGLSSELFSSLGWASQKAGTLTPKAAEQMCLPIETVVAVGGQDQKVSALGAGISQGDVTLSLGTAGAFEVLTASPLLDEEMSLPAFAGLYPGTYTLEACINTAGACLKWFRDNIFPDISYAGIDSLAASAEPGAGGVEVYPHFSGVSTAYTEDSLSGSVRGLSLMSSRAHIARAVLEGIAYQVRRNIQKAKDLGAECSRIKLCGGGAASGIWAQIIADVNNMPVQIFKTQELASCGAAMLAAQAAGESGENIACAAAEGLKEIKPDKSNAEVYNQLYRRYIENEF